MKSWNEIRKAATALSKRWKDAYDEKSQAQSFLKEFFAVFGVDAVTVATFEHRVKFADGAQGYIDCFWQGNVLVEMKSRGKDLDAAFQQAMEYVRSLPDVSQTPRAIVVSDFARIRFYDLAHDAVLTEFALKDLRKYVTLFGYMIGAEGNTEIREQDPVNRKAAEKMARLHDAMKSVGYTGHPLEVYLVRLLFCLFAEDTGIFKPEQLSHFIKCDSSPDGHDLAEKLASLFQTLNTAPERRLSILDDSLAAFPYVNGGLFAESLPMAAFSAEMRKALLDCGALDWSKISPAIFGAMFQGVMDEKARHDLGAHYTSEENNPESQSHPNKFPLAATKQQGAYARPAPRSVFVRSGATLRNESATDISVSGLTVDASGMGKLEGFAFAQGGTLSVEGLSGAQSVTIPAEFAGVSGYANLSRWQLAVVGGSSRHYMIGRVSETGITLCKRGLVMSFR